MKTLISMILLFASAYATADAAFAEDPSKAAAADSASDLKSRLDRINTLKGEYRQTVTGQDGKVIQTSEGEFALERPGYFYWSSREPFPQTIVGNPQKMWLYDPDLEQVTIRQQVLEGKDNPAQLLSGDVATLTDQFQVDELSEADQRQYVLKPHQDNASNYQSIALTFSGEKLSTLSFTDKMNQRTDIEFLSTQSNLPLEETLFEFTPPPGTDVIVDD